jgi:hypothetical protein
MKVLVNFIDIAKPGSMNVVEREGVIEWQEMQEDSS